MNAHTVQRQTQVTAHICNNSRVRSFNTRKLTRFVMFNYCLFYDKNSFFFGTIQFTWSKHFGGPRKPQPQSWQQPSPYQ